MTNERKQIAELITQTFGNINTIDSTELLHRAMTDEPDAQIILSRDSLLRLAARMVLDMRNSFDDDEDGLTALLSWGYLTACEHMIGLAETMPNRDIPAEVTALRAQLDKAMGVDAEIIEELMEVSVALKTSGITNFSISRKQAAERIDAVLTKLTTPPEETHD